MRLTKNFLLSEFRCHDGTDVPDEYISNVERLARNIQVIRDEINQPITIISGYRTEEWNEVVEGEDHSEHLEAKAGDLVAERLSPVELRRVILKLIKEGKIEEGGVGIYNSFVHYDVRGFKARWDERTKK